MQKVFRARPPCAYLCESFDDFVRTGVPAVLERFLTQVPGHAITLRNFRLHPPSAADVDGSTWRTTPSSANDAALTYEGVMKCDVLYNGVLIAAQEYLGRMPIMVGSSFCTADRRRDDYGGYFIVRGLKNCFIGQEVQRYNAPIHKYTRADGWHCEVASEGTSSRLRLFIAPKLGVMVEMRNHMKKNTALPLATFVRALGCVEPMDRLLTRPGDDIVFLEVGRASLPSLADARQAARPTCDNAGGPATDLEPMLTWFGENKVRHVLQHFLLPHVGTSLADDAQKVYWLARWAREVRSRTCALLTNVKSSSRSAPGAGRRRTGTTCRRSARGWRACSWRSSSGAR